MQPHQEPARPSGEPLARHDGSHAPVPARPTAHTSGVRLSPVDDAGQTTAEYALVLLGAAAVAGVLIRWATGSSGLTKLFGAVLGKLIRGISG